eukprot:gene5258-7307_t
MFDDQTGEEESKSNNCFFNPRVEIMLKKELQLKEEEANFTFKPKLPNYTRKSTKGEEGGGLSRFDRLYSDALKRQIETKEAKVETNLTFQPQIHTRGRSKSPSVNSKSDSRASSTERGSLRGASPSARTKYDPNSVLTFKPQISKRAKSLERKVDAPVSERLFAHDQISKEKQKKIKEDLESKSSLLFTFAPKTNNKTLKTKSAETELSVADRLGNYVKLRQQKILDAQKSKLERENSEITLKPTINKQSKWATPETPVYQRLSSSALKDLSSVISQMDEELTFKPKITKRASSVDSRGSDYGSVHDKLYEQGSYRKQMLEIEHDNLRRSEVENLSFRPSINEKSRVFAKKVNENYDSVPIFDRLSTNKLGYQELLSRVKTELELKECTFKPAVSGRRSTGSNEPIFERLTREAEEIRLCREAMEREKIQEEMKESTFKPKINPRSRSLGRSRSRSPTSKGSADEDNSDVYMRLSTASIRPMSVNPPTERYESPKKAVKLSEREIQEASRRLSESKTISYAIATADPAYSGLVDGDSSSKRVFLDEKEMQVMFDRLNRTPIQSMYNMEESPNSKHNRSVILSESECDQIFNRLNSSTTKSKMPTVSESGTPRTLSSFNNKRTFGRSRSMSGDSNVQITAQIKSFVGSPEAKSINQMSNDDLDQMNEFISDLNEIFPTATDNSNKQKSKSNNANNELKKQNVEISKPKGKSRAVTPNSAKSSETNNKVILISKMVKDQSLDTRLHPAGKYQNKSSKDTKNKEITKEMITTPQNKVNSRSSTPRNSSSQMIESSLSYSSEMKSMMLSEPIPGASKTPVLQTQFLKRSTPTYTPPVNTLVRKNSFKTSNKPSPETETNSKKVVNSSTVSKNEVIKQLDDIKQKTVNESKIGSLATSQRSISRGRVVSSAGYEHESTSAPILSTGTRSVSRSRSRSGGRSSDEMVDRAAARRERHRRDLITDSSKTNSVQLKVDESIVAAMNEDSLDGHDPSIGHSHSSHSEEEALARTESLRPSLTQLLNNNNSQNSTSNHTVKTIITSPSKPKTLVMDSQSSTETKMESYPPSPLRSKTPVIDTINSSLPSESGEMTPTAASPHKSKIKIIKENEATSSPTSNMKSSKQEKPVIKSSPPIMKYDAKSFTRSSSSNLPGSNNHLDSLEEKINFINALMAANSKSSKTVLLVNRSNSNEDTMSDQQDDIDVDYDEDD